MFDIKAIRENPDAFDAALARRGLEPHALSILEIDERWRALTVQAQEQQARRNEASKSIGAAKAKGDEVAAERLMAEVSSLKESLPQIEAQESEFAAKIQKMLETIPNLPLDSVPSGADENDNIQIYMRGALPAFDFAPKEHDVLGEPLGMDFETAQKYRARALSICAARLPV